MKAQINAQLGVGELEFKPEKMTTEELQASGNSSLKPNTMPRARLGAFPKSLHRSISYTYYAIILPVYCLVIERRETTWYFKTGDRIFYNPRNVPITLSLDERLQRFDLTIPKVAIELFRINAGRGGYYLANL